jgi:hypothetical protein
VKVLAVLIGKQEGGNAVEEFIADHIATAGQGTEDANLPPSDPQRLSPNPTLSDQPHKRGDSIGTDMGPSVGGVGREDCMEDWANLDLKELLDDFDDDDDDNNDRTDRHWKRGSEEPHDPTTSSTGNRDRYDKLDQVSEQRSPFFPHTSSSLPHYLTALSLQMANRARRAMPPKRFIQICSTSHRGLHGRTSSAGQLSRLTALERVHFLWEACLTGSVTDRRPLPAERPTERRPWALGRENQRNDVRRGWGRSSTNEKSHDNRPYWARDPHRRPEAERQHSRKQHYHRPQPPNRLSSPTRNYSQQHGHNKHKETTLNAAHGRKRDRERADNFTRSSYAQQPHHYGPRARCDKRSRKEDEPWSGPPA